MIPSAFNYYRPVKIDEAVGLISNLGDEARVIAGGHSLIPVMKQRLTDIKHLIDLSGINEIKGIKITGNEISIGAMTTQVELIISFIKGKIQTTSQFKAGCIFVGFFLSSCNEGNA